MQRSCCDSPTHGSDGSESLTLPVPSMQGHTWATPPGEELIAGQGWHDSGFAPTYSFAGHTVHGCKQQLEEGTGSEYIIHNAKLNGCSSPVGGQHDS